jgi:hypothetical protein
MIAGASALIQTKSLAVAVNVPLAIVIFAIAWSLGFLREFFVPVRDIRGK